MASLIPGFIIIDHDNPVSKFEPKSCSFTSYWQLVGASAGHIDYFTFQRNSKNYSKRTTRKGGTGFQLEEEFRIFLL